MPVLDDLPLSPSDDVGLFAALPRHGTALVAVSGGPDSVVLLGMLARYAAAGGPPVAAATVDHGLRPGSRAEAFEVGRLCEALAVPHAVLPWTDRPSGRVSQERARAARYGLLRAEAERIGAAILLTAHTLDDQAETLLIRIAAGSGLSGLAGMRREADRQGLRHMRPLLGVPKARLVATCRANGWPFVSDPSNADTAFARARWRRLAPGLAAEGLDAGRLGALASRLARADDALSCQAEAAFARLSTAGPQGAVALNGRALAAEPAEIALRVLTRALAGGPVRLDRLEACLAALLDAIVAGAGLRRTVAGRLVSLDRRGIVTVSPEPPRRRGRRVAVTVPAVSAPHSLGIDRSRA